MYKIEFYENQQGESDVWDFLETLRIKSTTNKDARIQYKKMLVFNTIRLSSTLTCLLKTEPISQPKSPSI